jgi:class 3 adenylate cyclase
MAVVEKLLDHLLELVGRVCRQFGGTNRFGAGDAYCPTFPEPGLALEAVECLSEAWSHSRQRDGYRCPINVAVHKGTLNLFRSYLYGNDVNVVSVIESLTHALGEGGGIFVTDRVKDDLVNTPWVARLQAVDLPGQRRGVEGIAGIVHTLEGDLDNARYWYRKVGRPFPGPDAVEEEIAAVRRRLGE